MTVHLTEVTTHSDLRKFIDYPNQLYSKNPYYVPALAKFELQTLDRTKNPAFDHCDSKYWLAWRNNRIVGRVAGILHFPELKQSGLARFGWMDFEDDLEVSEALLGAVSRWGQEAGATRIHGPLGFTDLDFEGTLIEGFDHIATQGTLYNHKYYQEHFEQHHFEKACDWIERRFAIPPTMPPKIERAASLAKNRYGFQVKKFRNNREMRSYGEEAFQLLNECYSHLYGFHPLSDRQIHHFIDQYFGFANKAFISLILDREGQMAGFAITLPSLSKALQFAKGSLLPFGWIPILRDLHLGKNLEMFLIAVKPKYQKLGVSAVIFHDLMMTCHQKGIQTMATGPMMETNKKILNMWTQFDEHALGLLRRRCFTKTL